MKKTLLYGLSAAMLLSLTACGAAQANQPDEPPPPETYVDQNILEDSFEVDIDPETGDVGYWNPNTEEDPLTDSLATTERPAGYDPNYDPTQSSIFKPLDDPWEGQAEIDFGD